MNQKNQKIWKSHTCFNDSLIQWFAFSVRFNNIESEKKILKNHTCFNDSLVQWFAFFVWFNNIDSEPKIWKSHTCFNDSLVQLFAYWELVNDRIIVIQRIHSFGSLKRFVQNQGIRAEAATILLRIWKMAFKSNVKVDWAAWILK